MILGGQVVKGRFFDLAFDLCLSKPRLKFLALTLFLDKLTLNIADILILTHNLLSDLFWGCDPKGTDSAGNGCNRHIVTLT